MLGFLNRFVDSNDRELKRIQPFVDEANALEPEIEALSPDSADMEMGPLATLALLMLQSTAEERRRRAAVFLLA
jgi:hypothetical protein